MAVLAPTLAVLDETDSGLDIDALRVVADGVNTDAGSGALDRAGHPLPAVARPTSCPTWSTCCLDGRILRSGDAGLALELEQRGYDWVRREATRRMNARSAADPVAALARGVRRAAPAERRRRSHRGAPRPSRAFARARLSRRARRGLEVHEPAAARGRATSRRPRARQALAATPLACPVVRPRTARCWSMAICTRQRPRSTACPAGLRAAIARTSRRRCRRRDRGCVSRRAAAPSASRRSMRRSAVTRSCIEAASARDDRHGAAPADRRAGR